MSPDIHEEVEGRERELLHLIGIDPPPRGRHRRCPFPDHPDRNPSWRWDDDKGRWFCSCSERGGTAIDALMRLDGLDFAAARDRARELLGVGEPRRRVARPALVPEPVPDPRLERNREHAQGIWRETEAVWPGLGLPWLYLREVRGLRRWRSDRLRWHPACPWEDGRRGCLVAPVNDHATGLVVGVWRILPALAGRVHRRGLGPTKGNCARLFPAAGPRLAVTEGVEDAVAYRELSGVPTWAALSAGNMARLVLPGRFQEVHVVADADQAGLAGAADLVRRLRAEGRERD